MSIRRTVCDYAGEEIHPGDLVCFASRVGNRVRVTDAFVYKVTTKLLGGRLVPMLKVAPTGSESGFVQRRSMRKLTVGSEHVRLIERGALSIDEVLELRESK